MDNRTPPDDLLAMSLSSPSSKQALDTVYQCMNTYGSQNPLLSEFMDLDTIGSRVTVFNSEDGQSHLVYPSDDPEKAGQEMLFDLAGYLVSFNLPGGNLPERLLHRPHSLRQRVTIAADDCSHLSKSVEAINTIKVFLDQYNTDGVTAHYSTRTLFNMDAIEAETPLFTHRNSRGPYREIDLPDNIDKHGHISNTVKKRGFYHSTDNSVQFGESDAAQSAKSEGNFLLPEYASSPGNFRHGQLVKISVTIRSTLRSGKNGDWRFLHVGLKRIILIGRTAELNLAKLRLDEYRREQAQKAEQSKMYKRPRQQEPIPMRTKEEHMRRQMSDLDLQDMEDDRNGF